jgi:cytochrome b-561 domain-containing protein 2
MNADAVAACVRRAATLPNFIHALLASLSLTLAFGVFDGSLFGWHPFAMSLGYLFFMAEGLIAAWAIRPALGDERVRGLEAHALTQLRAFAFAALGAATIIANKARNGKPHFRTLHGKLGLLTLVLTVLSPLLGAISFRRLGLIQRFPEQWHGRIKKAHRLVSF